MKSLTIPAQRAGESLTLELTAAQLLVACDLRPGTRVAVAVNIEETAALAAFLNPKPAPKEAEVGDVIGSTLMLPCVYGDGTTDDDHLNAVNLMHGTVSIETSEGEYCSCIHLTNENRIKLARFLGAVVPVAEPAPAVTTVPDSIAMFDVDEDQLSLRVTTNNNVEIEGYGLLIFNKTKAREIANWLIAKCS